jgi:predicted AAA+ superfamily ATPase
LIKRKIIKKLENWKNKGQDKAFILDGARQTGKTYILDWFCRSNFSSYLYITLTNDISNQILKSCG